LVRGLTRRSPPLSRPPWTPAAPGEPHLTYCTNIHPGESWAEVRANLERHVARVKAAVAPSRPFRVGLPLSAAAAGALGVVPPSPVRRGGDAGAPRGARGVPRVPPRPRVLRLHDQRLPLRT